MSYIKINIRTKVITFLYNNPYTNW